MNEFLEALSVHCPDDARLVFCQFRGDPGVQEVGQWRAHVWNGNVEFDEKANIYFCVSAMRRNARGEFRRRKENFAGGLCLMIDDLGDGPAAKFPMSTIDALPPTALIETSRDNFQAIYMFDRCVTDMLDFDALIRGFIEKQFLNEDTGMAGVNRVFRPPIGVNGKPKHDGWRVRLHSLSADRRYSIEEIAQAFKIKLVRQVRLPYAAQMLEGHRGWRMAAFSDVMDALEEAGMVKREADMAGWVEIQCPWVLDHTNEIDNGAAIRVPDEENAWYGAFRCHHGGCADRGWSQLTEWLAGEQEEWLALVNKKWSKM